MTTAAPTVDVAPDFPVLDSLRAVGALAVLVTHVSFWAGEYTLRGTVGVVLARLDVGVAIFFVLSGFLLSRAWFSRAQARTALPSAGRYFWKRLLRIAPVYLVVATIAMLTIGTNSEASMGKWISTLTLTDIYVDNGLPEGLSQTWSLAVEVSFYLLLPLLMFVVVGRGHRGLRPWRTLAVLGALCVLSVAWIVDLAARVPGGGDRSVTEWLPSYLIWFCVGIAIALVQVWHSSGTAPLRLSGAVHQIASTPGTCWAAVAGLLLVAATPVAGPTLIVSPTSGEALGKNLIYAAIGGLIVLTGVFTQRESLYVRVMSHRLPRHLGHISYALFLVHLPILHLTMHLTGYNLFDGHFLQILIIDLVVSLVAAELLYRFVELPFMRLRGLRAHAGSATTVTAPRSATRTR